MLKDPITTCCFLALTYVTLLEGEKGDKPMMLLSCPSLATFAWTWLKMMTIHVSKHPGTPVDHYKVVYWIIFLVGEFSPSHVTIGLGSWGQNFAQKPLLHYACGAQNQCQIEVGWGWIWTFCNNTLQTHHELVRLSSTGQYAGSSSIVIQVLQNCIVG